MRKIASGMLGAALVFSASGAFAQAFGAKGTPAISADRLFGFSITNETLEFPAPVGEREADTTVFGFGWQGGARPSPYEVPRLAFDYFLVDSLSLGGSIGYASISTEFEPGDGEAEGSAFVIAPRVGYVWNFNNWAAFWIRGGFTYHSFSYGDDDDAEENAFALTIEPTFVLSPTAHWGFVLGPTLDIAFTGEREVGGADPDLSYTSIGILRAGLIAWF
ncbi:MAG TPA: hypothetical protein VK524_12230 [Polyangiaceae bacterium]|nr:hypothetical protein [Polyangiaceae bacterium]